MSAALRWGVLGTGGIAGKQVADLLANGHTVTAVGSRSAGSAEAFAARHGIRAHASYEALVEDPDVDVVYVATPAHVHLENGLLAIAAGKHVLMEKPFTVDAAQARELVDAADAADVVLLEALWTRFLPHMARVREIVREGTIGEIRTIIAESGQRLPQDADFRLNRADLAGGSLLDIGIYPISFAIDLLGFPADVTSRATLGPTGVDLQTSAILTYPSGAQAICQTAIDVKGPNRAAVLGTEGRIEIDTTFYAPTSFVVIANDGTVIERWTNEVAPRGMQYQAAELERLVRTGERRSPLLTSEDSIALMELLDGIRRQNGIVLAGR
ncbi:Gfo/Idh/MocA family oxidoreductase [Microbacterium sp. ET2]|uniref:Gfo/Idh/MocA family protein n=1 Tax=Microbacterium albipurpureum TaxID=3050384 RepID=UPI00259CF190|nr:Gfo/Idh/MocA family oxidoreductase [Microbacterium sp. ET2 (Ac-2212)]WJL96752.1 Gfo/Idh/MocA family oxidoreductase [Microbacterium sp. ET2 (Ac-2212)]